ncbi:MAG: DUF6391 domain-containing protein [Chloroflexi bacterium]|nr:DUF6391 domain-containing protein [Chloroflexota bacterium]MDA1240832.1 DUF6391 domain-containing protein [Chloroflexota bacterium]MQC48356.1 hypothetical protein [Chloroflexota bacterium]
MGPLVDLARDWLMDVRRNHALEHATVSVLFARRGPQRLAGRAKSDGFYIIGRIEPDLLRSCADEALLRLQRGETGLAVSPMCGTNLAVTGALCALATIGSLARTRGSKRRDRLGDAVSLSMVAAVVAQPAGRLLQEKITTLADHGQVEVTGVREYFPGFMKVSTRRNA